jgi:hypothetical protein
MNDYVNLNNLIKTKIRITCHQMIAHMISYILRENLIFEGILQRFQRIF